MNKLIAIPQMSAGIIIYIIHFILVRTCPSYNAIPIRWYIGDILSLIVCVPLFCNIEILLGLKKNKKLLFETIFYFIIFSLLYEVILPLKNKELTSDLFDIVSYAFSGFILIFTDMKLNLGLKKHRILKYANLKSKDGIR
jgi:hypothetical protein